MMMIHETKHWSCLMPAVDKLILGSIQWACHDRVRYGLSVDGVKGRLRAFVSNNVTALRDVSFLFRWVWYSYWVEISNLYGRCRAE